MRKTLTFLFLLTLLMTLPQKADAVAYQVVMDPYSLGAVTANTAATKAVENAHNKELDTIRSKQRAIETYTASMATIKDLYRMTMQNVTGFGSESAYMRALSRQLAMIPWNVWRATKAINECPVVNYVNCLKEITDLQMQTVEVVKMFVDVVTNGKISLQNNYNNSTGTLSELMRKAQIGKGDGYNFLDRSSRMDLCLKLLSQASDINARLVGIMYICQYCRSVSNLLYNLDPDTWCDMMTGKVIAENVIDSWNMEMRGV